MAISAELLEFVKTGLDRRIPKNQLEEVLRKAGWEQEQVTRAVGRYADVDFAIPVPRPSSYVTPREAFIYVLMFATLYLSAYHLGSLVFELINKAFPDAAAQQYESLRADSTIRWAVASIVVSFPVFLYMARLIGSELRADVTKRTSKIRKQLTYLTLLIAAAVLIGDVTTLIYNFLGGELTVRFALKIATAAAIAGTAFAYYLRQLRDDERALSL
jgi:hypothetical protein